MDMNRTEFFVVLNIQCRRRGQDYQDPVVLILLAAESPRMRWHVWLSLRQSQECLGAAWTPETTVGLAPDLRHTILVIDGFLKSEICQEQSHMSNYN